MIKRMAMFAVGLLLIGGGTANAQIQEQTSIGPRIGANFSNVSNVDGSESITGVAFGLTSTYSISEQSGLTVDLLYSQEGYKTDFEEVKLNYLQIPIYYDLFFGELGEAFRPKIYVGIVPGFFLNGKINGGESNKEFYNSFVVAASGGLGFNYRVGSRMWLNADLRAYWGLSDLRSDKGVDSDVIAGKTIQPSIGLAYGLGKL